MNLTNLINQLNSLQEQYEFSDSHLAAKIGITLDDLHRFRSGKITTGAEARLIESFVEKLSANIYPTKLLDKMERLLALTFKEQSITVIGSVSGAGKTLASERFSNENHYAIYLYIPEVITPRYLLQLIAQKLALPWLGLSIQQMFETISRTLSVADGCLFIFDESDRLSRKMFEILRDLWHDGKGNIGIAFVGDENLMRKIRRGESLRENLIRLMRRVKYHEIMDPLHPDDVRMAFKQAFGKHKIKDETIKEVYRRFNKLGGFGSIINIIDYVKKLSERSGDVPNDEMVSESIRRLKI